MFGRYSLRVDSKEVGKVFLFESFTSRKAAQERCDDCNRTWTELGQKIFAEVWDRKMASEIRQALREGDLREAIRKAHKVGMSVDGFSEIVKSVNNE